MAPGGPGQAHHIVHQFGLDVHPGSLILELRQLPKGENRANLQKGVALLPAQNHVPLVLGRRVAHGQANGEPVHLAVWQELGSGGSNRVLGGDDCEGLRNGMGLAVYGDLPLLHGLQKGGLGPGGGPVQLIRQEEIAQHGPGLVGHGAGLFVVNRIAGHV